VFSPLLEPTIVFLLLCGWTWALCSVLARGESYGWLLAILFVPPVGLPLYAANRLSGGIIDRKFESIRNRERIVELESLVESDPTFDRRTELANLLHREGRHRDALVQLDAAMQVDEDDRRVQYLAAKALVGLGRGDAAIPHLEFVLRIDPSYDFGHAVLELARLHRAAGQPAAALPWLESSYRRQPLPRVAVALAELLDEAGRRPDAVATLRHLLQLADGGSLPLRDKRERQALSAARALLALWKA